MRISFRASDSCRCDQAISAQLPDVSRSYIHNNVTELTINGISAKLSHRVKVGDMVCAAIVEYPVATPTPCYLPFDVVHEDDHLLVINKPNNISVHPGAHHALDTEPTIVQGLHYRYPQLIPTESDSTDGANKLYRNGIIHRLDKKTSGLLLLAKRTDAIEPLQMLFRKRLIHKRYLAIVRGHPPTPNGTFKDTLIRHPVHRQRFTTSTNIAAGKYAITDYHCLWNDEMLTVAILQPHTGRTHQLRVQLAARNTSIVGDDVYGKAQQSLRARYPTLTNRMYLHAIRLEFRHPFTGQFLKLCAELPQPFRPLIAAIRSG